MPEVPCFLSSACTYVPLFTSKGNLFAGQIPDWYTTESLGISILNS